MIHTCLRYNSSLSRRGPSAAVGGPNGYCHFHLGNLNHVGRNLLKLNESRSHSDVLLVEVLPCARRAEDSQTLKTLKLKFRFYRWSVSRWSCAPSFYKRPRRCFLGGELDPSRVTWPWGVVISNVKMCHTSSSFVRRFLEMCSVPNLSGVSRSTSGFEECQVPMIPGH